MIPAEERKVKVLKNGKEAKITVLEGRAKIKGTG